MYCKNQPSSDRGQRFSASSDQNVKKVQDWPLCRSHAARRTRGKAPPRRPGIRLAIRKRCKPALPAPDQHTKDMPFQLCTVARRSSTAACSAVSAFFFLTLSLG